jgi:formylmethanofuran dehydrogenase subunit E
MGTFALGKLGVPRGSFDLEVTHHTPKQVQYTCVADGAAAATGASLGKLNLALAEAESANVRTTYRRKSTGQSVTLRPAAAFVARYKDVPREKLADAGREVMDLPEDQVFEVVP